MSELTPEARRAALEARRAKLNDAQRALLQKGLAGPLAPRPPCVVQLASGTGTPLFCIHPAGGDVLCFGPLAKRLQGRPVWGLQSPGMAGECAPFTSLEAIAGHFVDAILQVQPQGPYHLAGWSLGAQVAFEVARQLEAKKARVGLVALIDGDPEAGAKARQALKGPQAFDDHATWLIGIADYLEKLWGQHIAISEADLEGIAPAQQLNVFLDAAKATELPHTALPSAAQLERVLGVYKSNLKALIDYPLPQYRGSIALLLAEEGPADEPEFSERVQRGWGAVVQGLLDVRWVRGDHHTVMAEPQVDSLAEQLSELIARNSQEQV